MSDNDPKGLLADLTDAELASMPAAPKLYAQQPITAEALQAAGWNYILWNGIMPGYWQTLTSDNADRLDGPYLEVMFNERKDLPPESFTVYIVGANFKKMAKGVRTMSDLSDLHRLLTGAWTSGVERPHLRREFTGG